MRTNQIPPCFFIVFLPWCGVRCVERLARAWHGYVSRPPLREPDCRSGSPLRVVLRIVGKTMLSSVVRWRVAQWCSRDVYPVPEQGACPRPRATHDQPVFPHRPCAIAARRSSARLASGIARDLASAVRPSSRSCSAGRFYTNAECVPRATVCMWYAA